jgi:hypothetical protein
VGADGTGVLRVPMWAWSVAVCSSNVEAVGSGVLLMWARAVGVGALFETDREFGHARSDKA